MAIQSLQLTNFRNIIAANIDLSQQINLFYGQNGSGKTSLLEAIYLLSRGKSFRISQISRTITQDKPESVLFCRCDNQEQEHKIGAQRLLNGSKKLHLDGKEHNQADISRLLPVQLLSTDGFRLFTDGPKNRRQFLDYGVFHTEPAFLKEWQQYQHALKQRNALLKTNAPLNQLRLWDEPLCRHGEAIHGYRQLYTQLLKPIIMELIEKLTGLTGLEARYSKGWNQSLSLEEAISENLDSDYRLNYSQAGPQRAEFQLYTQGQPIQEVFSQGQLKLAAYAVNLAQGLLLYQQKNIAPIFLIDDLPSELDHDRRRLVMQQLQDIPCQILITGIELEDLEQLFQSTEELEQCSMFHVEHGEISKVPVKSEQSA